MKIKAEPLKDKAISQEGMPIKCAGTFYYSEDVKAAVQWLIKKLPDMATKIDDDTHSIDWVGVFELVYEAFSDVVEVQKDEL